MLTVKYLKEQTEEAIKLLAVKKFDGKEIVAKVLDADADRVAIQQNLNDLQSEMNTLSKEIGRLFKEKKIDEANVAKEKTAAIKDQVKDGETKLAEAEALLKSLLVKIPNVPHPSVPEGSSDTDNEEIRSGGTKPQLENALPHWELAKKYDLIDFELGVKLTGTGFPVYKGKGAKLQRALVNFFLNEAESVGYTEVQPPIMVNEDSGFGTGQLPDKEGQMYHVGVDNLYLIPTAEVPVTNMYRDVILAEDQLPIKNTAYTPCFRREAGSYGADVRGLNRLHQFDKVEIVRVDTPERSYQALDEMVAYVEGLVNKLGLPYRILRLCGGDISFHSALTFDFEVYSAGQDKWLEVSSVSNFESFQANRMKLRYKSAETKKTVVAHTLNGSALALPRIVAAILENNQTIDGIKIPECLQPFTGFSIIA